MKRRLRKVTTKQIKLSDDNYLSILQSTLRWNKIPENYISFIKYKEGAVCIEKDGQSWIVYIGERGEKYDVKSFKEINSACIEVMERCAESKEHLQLMLDSYKEKLDRLPIMKEFMSYASVLPVISTSKYKVGDTVYVIHNNRVNEATVIGISKYFCTLQLNKEEHSIIRVRTHRLHHSFTEASLHVGEPSHKNEISKENEINKVKVHK